jgi:hypothetical protein
MDVFSNSSDAELSSLEAIQVVGDPNDSASDPRSCNPVILNVNPSSSVPGTDEPEINASAAEQGWAAMIGIGWRERCVLHPGISNQGTNVWLYSAIAMEAQDSARTHTAVAENQIVRAQVISLYLDCDAAGLKMRRTQFATHSVVRQASVLHWQDEVSGKITGRRETCFHRGRLLRETRSREN